MARRYNTGVSRLLLSVLAGLALALLFTASPVGVIVLATAPAVAVVAARRLDRDDRRVLFTIFGVALLGMDSVNMAIARRRHIWDRLATDLRPRALGEHVREVTLDTLEPALDGIVAGAARGRWIVRI